MICCHFLTGSTGKPMQKLQQIQPARMWCDLKDLICARRYSSIKHVNLRHWGIVNHRLVDEMEYYSPQSHIIYGSKESHPTIATIILRQTSNNFKCNRSIFDTGGHKWIKIKSLTSKKIRNYTANEVCLNSTKLATMCFYHAA